MTPNNRLKSVVWMCAMALLVSACGETGDTAAPADGRDSDETGPGPAPEAREAAAEDGADALDRLDVAAREACAAGDENFAAALPAGTAFAARGGDARVHAGWNVDGRVNEAIIRTGALDDAARLEFDGAVADFLRHNMVAGFDRTGLTGAYRYRDGRFCIVQTEDEVITAFQDAVRVVEALPAGE